METNNSETVSGTNQNGEPQSNQQQQTNQPQRAAQPQNSRESGPRTMFLEYDRHLPGQHSISAIIKDPGEKRGKVAARIYTEFSGEPKTASYTAKDAQGNVIVTSSKLWEVKKNIRENAAPLLEKAKQVKRIVQKEAKAIGNKVVDEGKEFAGAAKEIITGTGRENELKNIRNRKVEQNKGRELEQ